MGRALQARPARELQCREMFEIKARIADIEAVGRRSSQLIEGAYADLLSRQIQRTEFPNPEIT
jgi:hypothetical protein